MRRCYENEVGRWWLARASDPAHARAYSKVVRCIHDAAGRSPRLIVDYACGAGHLLTRLAWRFPHARLIGLDGSLLLLEVARRRIGRMGREAERRIRLRAEKLPRSPAPRLGAELAVYAFPNMYPARGPRREPDPCESAAARRLARLRDPAAGGEPSLPGPSAGELLRGRAVSWDLRRVLADGGLCVRVEYAEVPRHQLSRAELLRVAFEEGSLSDEIAGERVRPWFRLLASAYVRSGVIEDVYQQTGDESDRHGGYAITVLRAVAGGRGF